MARTSGGSVGDRMLRAISLPSEAGDGMTVDERMHRAMDHFEHGIGTSAVLERLAIGSADWGTRALFG